MCQILNWPKAAIDNASSYLHHSSNAELLEMSQKMIEAQTAEITELSNWLAQNRITEWFI